MHTDQFRNDLNATIKTDTEGKISKMLESPLPADTQIVLVNTIFLEAKWARPLAVEEDFVFTSGPQSDKIPAVRFPSCRHNRVRIGDGKHFPGSWITAWCAFGTKDYGILLAMPEGDPAAVSFLNDKERHIFVYAMSSILDPEAQHYMDAVFPKMKVESEIPFEDILSKQGFIPHAMTPGSADFSMLSPQATTGSQFHLSKILQKAVFQLDEMGVQAAAASAGCATLMSKPWHLGEILFNRPFKLFIVHEPSRTPLFEATIIEKPEQPNMTWKR